MLKAAAVLALALAAAAPAAAQSNAAQSEAAQSDAAWVRPEVQRLVQPSNAKRLEALRRLLDEKGVRYEIHEFPGSEESRGVPGHNLVITLGDGPKDIVLGAHYDAEALDSGQLVEGVVDNAASVVALVRAAESLAGRDNQHRIRIVFFDQEELGLLGSEAWLKSQDRSRIAAAVNFDVVGYGDTVIYGGLKSDTAGVVREAVQTVCARKAIDCIRFQSYPPSDDRSFAAAGVPVVSIGLQPAADAHQMWLLMHKGPHSGLAQGVTPRVFSLIHTPADNMGALEPSAVVLAWEMAVDVVIELDEKLAPR